MAKKYFTKALGETIAKGALRVNSGRYHVISGEAQRWSVVPDGHIRPLKIFPTKREAIDFAKQTASRLTGEVFIHEKTGQIKNTISFV